MTKKPWFESWFDSPYYHILYQDRNEQEARDFIDILLKSLTPQLLAQRTAQSIRILDLACGKGRHSIYMAEKGFDVTGIDLSASSIEYARQFENPNLHFYQNDMRKAFRINYFDFIFNFFTSFGYFDKESDNLLALKQVANGLRPNGVFVMDYFNSKWVRKTLTTNYIQHANGIDFHIKKYIRQGHVFKNIAFTTEGVKYQFRERVRLFELNDFKPIFEKAGLKITDIYGDYELNPFNENASKRLIIKAVKR